MFLLPPKKRLIKVSQILLHPKNVHEVLPIKKLYNRSLFFPTSVTSLYVTFIDIYAYFIKNMAKNTYKKCSFSVFVNHEGVKVKVVNYIKHLKRKLFWAKEKWVKLNDCMFFQNAASSHTSKLVQDFLTEGNIFTFVSKNDHIFSLIRTV